MLQMRRLFQGWLIAISFVCASESVAQTYGVLVLDSNRLYDESAYAKAMLDPINRQLVEIEAEISEIIRLLQIEERMLAEMRPDMPAEEFARAAAGFDEKVQGLREQQDARIRQIEFETRSQRDTFFTQIIPVIREVVEERRASVILEASQVVFAHPDNDITNELITRVDAFFLKEPTETNN